MFAHLAHNRVSVATSHAAKRAGVAAFARDRSGGVVIPFALGVIVMCVFVGAAVDFGRWLHARHQTLAAIDAAVLAGARVLQLDESDVNGAIAAAQKYYAENTKHRLALVSDTISFQPTEDNTSFTASGNAFIATPLLSFVSVNKLPILATTGAEYSKAQLAIGGNSKDAVEIALMLDVTGSMSGSKVTDMKTAAKDLVEIVITTHSAPHTRIALVPFSEGVRLPSSANTAARGSPASTITVSYTCSGGGGGGKGGKGGGWGGGSSTCSKTYYRTSCVVERKGADRYTDAAPGTGNYVMTLYGTSSSDCPLNTSMELVPLTNDKDLLTTKITNLSVSGGTAGQIGTAWAWYTLSPNWNTLWDSSSSYAAAYDFEGQKIAILMTDGEYNTEYDANGVQTGSTGAGSAANDSSTNQARALCAAMKAKGIKIYTVGFDLGGNQSAINTMNQCATDPTMAYNADNGAQLKQAFRDIALKISTLYLSK